MNKKIWLFVILGLALIGIAIAQITQNPPSIPNGFTLNMPLLPSSTGQQFGACSYNPNEMYADNIKIWYNEPTTFNQAQVYYTYQIKTKNCAKGFVGNISYNILANPTSGALVNSIQQDFQQQILSAIQIPTPEASPLATGNSPNPNAGGTQVP